MSIRSMNARSFPFWCGLVSIHATKDGEEKVLPRYSTLRSAIKPSTASSTPACERLASLKNLIG